jgi:hypothetical protein
MMLKLRYAGAIGAGLALALSACGDGATAPRHGAPATLTATAGAGVQTAVVGSAVAQAPAVRVADADGRPVPGVPVTFSVRAGGGAVTGATATSNAEGVASAGTWTLGTVAGSNELVAEIPGVAEVIFRATATAGPAATVVAHEWNGAVGAPGVAVVPSPAVRVADAHDNPVAGVQVTFATAAGGGSVTGGAVTTDGQGIARVGAWTLGAVGENTLTATVAGLPPVVFTATAAQDGCVAAPYQIGQTVQGTLTATDCLIGTVRVDLFSLNLAAQQAFTMAVNSSALRAGIVVESPTGSNFIGYLTMTAVGTQANLRLLLPAGGYRARIRPVNPGETGAYTLTSSAGLPAGCMTVLTVRGVAVAGTIATTDCSAGGRHFDRFGVWLEAGQSISASAQASVAHRLELWGGSGGDSLVAESAAVNAPSLSYTAPGAGYVYLHVMNAQVGGTSAYTLTIN